MKNDIVKHNAGWNLSHSYARLPERFFTRVDPAPVRNPELLFFNRPLAISLGLDPDQLERGDAALIFSGNLIPQG